MRRSDRPIEKQAELENETHVKLKAKKSRSENIINIYTTDNGTLVEIFKHMNYCQLTNNSLVSRRYRNLIETHRHKLALLYVDYIGMDRTNNDSPFIEIFNKVFSSETYNEWISRNRYSKQVALEDQNAGMQSIQYVRKFYKFWAGAIYEDSNHSHITKRIFDARIELNHENWPVFQHFVRLLTDPFIYIHILILTTQVDVFNFLAVTINSRHNHLQCDELLVSLDGNMQKFMSWIKGHVLCNEFAIYDFSNLNYDEEFLDIFMTGASFIPEIVVKYYDLRKVVVIIVQKFMNLKNCDGNQLVESIRGTFYDHQNVEGMKRCYAGFLVKEKRWDDDRCTEEIFEFINTNIGKKLQLTITELSCRVPYFSLKNASCAPQRQRVEFEFEDDDENDCGNGRFRLARNKVYDFEEFGYKHDFAFGAGTRNGRLGFCFSSEDRQIAFYDLQDSVKIGVRNGSEATTEIWNKGDWSQFYYAVRGRSIKLIYGSPKERQEKCTVGE